MKIKANVKHVGEVRTGTSKTTGNKWAIRDVLLSWTDEAGKSFINASIDGDTWAGCGIETGDNVCAELQFHTRLLPSGTVANEIRIISIQHQQNS